jgi:hypothetical protein
MRDEKDPGTTEMPLRRRPGRPAKYGDGAMSAATRAKLYRIRRKCRLVGVDTPVTEWSEVRLLDELKAAMRFDDGTNSNYTVHMVLREIARRHPERDVEWDD